MNNCCLFLRGEVFITDATEECSQDITGLDGCLERPKSFTKLGNTSLLEFSVVSDIIGRENIFNKALERSRVNIEAVTINMTLECASKKNIIQAFFGDEINYEINEKTDTFCFDPGAETYILSRVPIEETVFLTDAFGNPVYFLTKDLDYTIVDNKLKVLDADLMPSSAVNIKVEYSFENLESYEIDALRLEPKYKEILFVGKNATGESEEVFELRCFRVLLKPIETFDLISKGAFFNLPLIGVVEESNNGWFKLKRQFRGKDELGNIIY